jgi:hypothetical protein
MKLATVRKFERAYKALYDAAKADPAASALVKDYETNMVAWWNRRREMELALAAKRDKGVVLFTVFIPERNCLREYTRTPNRSANTFHWRHSFSPTGYSAATPNWDTASNFWTPLNDFRRAMSKEVAV